MGPVGLSDEARAAVEKNALLNALRHQGKAEVGAVIGKVLGELPDLRAMADLVGQEAKGTVSRVNSLTAAQQQQLLDERYPGSVPPAAKEGRVGLPPLPQAQKGKVAFRLPPEPSGFMTIGHAMAFTINYLYREMYEGELWLRFEDTNPRKASKRFYRSFEDGISWLGIECDHKKNISEDLEIIYEYGRGMLETGSAYACSCDPERVKKWRFEGKECEHRDKTPEDNLKVWDSMLEREFAEGSYVVRLKGDMASADYSLRDPNLFRIIDHEHPITGTKYVVWPTYNLANTIEDELCGITHILRSSEFQPSLQDFIRKTLRLREPVVIQFSRFNFKGTPVQKRLLRPLVEKGLVSGWDDPRMPTVEGVRRRGIIPGAIRQFTLNVGYTKSEHEYDWSLLYAVNRRLLDPISKRVYFVPDPVKVVLAGTPTKTVSIPFHPESDLGSRSFSVGNEVFVPRSDLEALEEGSSFRLMELFNLKLEANGPQPRASYAGDSVDRETRKVQWVLPGAVSVNVQVAGALFNDAGNFDPSSLTTVEGMAEPSVSTLKPGDIVQFPRFGFCREDSDRTFILAHR